MCDTGDYIGLEPNIALTIKLHFLTNPRRVISIVNILAYISGALEEISAV